MRDSIASALEKSPADYTEIRIEETESTAVALRGSDLEVADARIDRGGIVRCLHRGSGWGVATFNGLEDLPGRVKDASECSRAVSVEEPIELAPVEPVEDSVEVELGRDPREVSLAEKRGIVEGVNEIILGHSDKIQDAVTRCLDVVGTVTFASSEGSYITQEHARVQLYATAIAKQGDDVQQAYGWASSNAGYENIGGTEELAREAAERAVGLLGAPPVKGDTYTVVLNQELAGVFTHEAFGHLSESDFVYENPQAQKMMTLGRRFGPETLVIADDGSIPGLRGTKRYDDEGTPMRRNDLIRDGVLVGRLHSRETAARMGEEPTGNALATGYRYAPIVRMTNTFIEPRDVSFEDMIGDIELGVYACDNVGGQTALESFSFSAAYGYMIRNGKIAEMVRDVILSGNLFDTLANIDAIGSDFEWTQIGYCGKGQDGLPVSEGAPHVRIRDVLIGGE